MQIKWHSRNEITRDFSTTPVFCPKSYWTPLLGHPNLEMFLSELGKELFKTVTLVTFTDKTLAGRS